MAKLINSETFMSMLRSGLFRVEHNVENDSLHTVLWSGKKIIATRNKQGVCFFVETAMNDAEKIIIEK